MEDFDTEDNHLEEIRLRAAGYISASIDDINELVEAGATGYKGILTHLHKALEAMNIKIDGE